MTSSSCIHPTAIIGDQVKLGINVTIGPYCVIDGEVEIGDETTLMSHVSMTGRTKIGARCQIFPFSSIGHRPQDLKYQGEFSSLTIGDATVIREYVTIQPGTKHGIMKTEVGHHCLLMTGCHVAHDCLVGNHVILANSATLAGHVIVGDHVIIGGLSAVHQFVRIGDCAIIGGMSGVEHDVIPYGSVKGERASLTGLNLIGLKRHGVGREEIDKMREAYKRLFSQQQTLAERVEQTSETFLDQIRIQEIVDFMRADSTRALCVPKDHDAL